MPALAVAVERPLPARPRRPAGSRAPPLPARAGGGGTRTRRRSRCRAGRRPAPRSTWPAVRPPAGPGRGRREGTRVLPQARPWRDGPAGRSACGSRGRRQGTGAVARRWCRDRRRHPVAPLLAGHAGGGRSRGDRGARICPDPPSEGGGPAMTGRPPPVASRHPDVRCLTLHGGEGPGEARLADRHRRAAASDAARLFRGRPSASPSRRRSRAVPR